MHANHHHWLNYLALILTHLLNLKEWEELESNQYLPSYHPWVFCQLNYLPGCPTNAKCGKIVGQKAIEYQMNSTRFATRWRTLATFASVRRANPSHPGTKLKKPIKI